MAPTGALINETIQVGGPGLPVAAADNASASGKCEVYVGHNETERCTEWEYFGDIGNTIVSQANELTLPSIEVGPTALA